MSDITISYKGSSIATMDATGTKTLLTEGKYCEDDITVDYVKPSGGGSSDTIDSDYIKLEYAIVTIGANSVVNATQVIPYLLGLADFSTTDALFAWCSVIDHNGWIQNQYVCTDINNRLDNARKFYRYRNNAISSTNEGAGYDATLNPGDKYLVSCIRWKGAPTV